MAATGDGSKSSYQKLSVGVIYITSLMPQNTFRTAYAKTLDRGKVQLMKGKKQKRQIMYGELGIFEHEQQTETGVQAFMIDEREDSTKKRLLPKSELQVEEKGLTFCRAVHFMVGETVGGGLVALPAAMVNCGYGGIPCILAIAVICTYCCILLARCYTTVSTNLGATFESRKPYPIIGSAAFGNIGKYAVSFALYTNLTLVPLVYLLLCSSTISGLVSLPIPSLSSMANFRVWVAITTCIIIPMCWFGTPKDFWGVGVFATLTVVFASVIITSVLIAAAPKSLSSVKQPPVNFFTVSSGLGTFVFAFTGSALAPTVQTDMRKQKHFHLVISTAYSTAFVLYVLPAISGLIVLGDSVTPNIVDAMEKFTDRKILVALTYATKLMLAFHFLFAFVMKLNPVFQQLETTFSVPDKFSWKRCLVRSALVLLLFAGAELFPKFKPVVDLAGGSVNVFLCFIFPCSFYLKLHWKDTTLWMATVIISIMTITTLIAVSSTYSNILEINRALHEIYSGQTSSRTP